MERFERGDLITEPLDGSVRDLRFRPLLRDDLPPAVRWLAVNG